MEVKPKIIIKSNFPLPLVEKYYKDFEVNYINSLEGLKELKDLVIVYMDSKNLLFTEKTDLLLDLTSKRLSHHAVVTHSLKGRAIVSKANNILNILADEVKHFNIVVPGIGCNSNSTDDMEAVQTFIYLVSHKDNKDLWGLSKYNHKDIPKNVDAVLETVSILSEIPLDVTTKVIKSLKYAVHIEALKRLEVGVNLEDVIVQIGDIGQAYIDDSHVFVCDLGVRGLTKIANEIQLNAKDAIDLCISGYSHKMLQEGE